MQKHLDIIRQKPATTKRRVMTKRTKLIAALVGLLVLIAVVAGIWYYYANRATTFIDSSKYQAIFLTNNQAYIGKLQRLSDGSYRLTDVYYIQQAQNSAASTGQNAASAGQTSQGDTPTLVKFTQTLPGPEDEIIFNSSQVSFWENLKPDGKVSKAIADSKNKK